MSYKRISTEDHRTVMDTLLYDNLQDGIDESKQDLSEIHSSLQELSESTSELQKTTTGINEEISDIQKQIGDLSSDGGNLSEQQEVMKKEIANIQSELNSVKNQVQVLGSITILPNEWTPEQTFIVQNGNFKTSSSIYVVWSDIVVMSKSGVTYFVQQDGILVIHVDILPVNSVSIERLEVYNYECSN